MRGHWFSLVVLFFQSFPLRVRNKTFCSPRCPFPVAKQTFLAFSHSATLPLKGGNLTYRLLPSASAQARCNGSALGGDFVKQVLHAQVLFPGAVEHMPYVMLGCLCVRKFSRICFCSCQTTVRLGSSGSPRTDVRSPLV